MVLGGLTNIHSIGGRLDLIFELYAYEKPKFRCKTLLGDAFFLAASIKKLAPMKSLANIARPCFGVRPLG